MKRNRSEIKISKNILLKRADVKLLPALCEDFSQLTPQSLSQLCTAFKTKNFNASFLSAHSFITLPPKMHFDTEGGFFKYLTSKI